MSRLSVDLVSDIVCPWCVIGYYRLKQAAGRLGVELDIRWHPFELNPAMPPEGEDLYQHFHNKYGMDWDKTDALGDTLQGFGEPLGFTFNYPQGNRMRNTFKAHQLSAWAKQQGAEDRLYEALFEAYFTRQQDIASTKVLLQIVASLQLDSADAEEALFDERFAAAVKAEVSGWQSRGVHSVPATIFQERYLLSGAQPVEHYEEQIHKAMDEADTLLSQADHH